MENSNIYEYILEDGKKRCKKGYKRVPKTMRCRLNKYLKKSEIENKVSKTQKTTTIQKGKKREIMLREQLLNKLRLEKEKQKERENKLREQLLNKLRLEKEKERNMKLKLQKKKEEEKRKIQEKKEEEKRKLLLKKEEEQKLKSIVEYEMKDGEKRCKKGFKRIPKTNRCLNSSVKQTKQITQVNKDKDKITEATIDTVKYVLGDREKRCKKGYSRIPNTKTCLKRTSKIEHKKIPISEKTISKKTASKRTVKNDESPGFFTKLFKPKKIILPAKTIRKIKKLKKIKTIKYQSPKNEITPLSRPVYSIQDTKSKDAIEIKDHDDTNTIIIKRVPKDVSDVSTKLKSLVPSMNKYGFITTINKNSDDLITLTKRKNITECIDNYSKINNWQVGNLKDLEVLLKDGSCVPSNSTLGKQELIKMLYRENKPECIISPKQSYANCWMNCLFMSYFISDLGSHHNKWMRKAMILSETPNGNKFTNNKLNILFRRLNMSIQASFDCNKSYVGLLNTNEIIKGIYSKLLPTKALRDFYKLHNIEIRKVGQAGNPNIYFKLLSLYLSGLRSQCKKPFLKTGIFHIEYDIASINSGFYDETMTIYYDCLSKDLEYVDFNRLTNINILSFNNKRMGKKMPKYIKYEDIRMMKPVGVFKLDNVNLIDNEGHHFVSFLTIKNNYYAFDGASFSQLHSFDWIKYINKNVNMRFSLDKTGETTGLDFNFMIGHGEYNYYRV